MMELHWLLTAGSFFRSHPLPPGVTFLRGEGEKKTEFEAGRTGSRFMITHDIGCQYDNGAVCLVRGRALGLSLSGVRRVPDWA